MDEDSLIMIVVADDDLEQEKCKEIVLQAIREGTGYTAVLDDNKRRLECISNETIPDFCVGTKEEALDIVKDFPANNVRVAVLCSEGSDPKSDIVPEFPDGVQVIQKSI